MHYYKKNIGDYAKKTGRLTMLQHGSYTLLIDSCYDRERFPTLEEAIDWTWASSTEEVEAVKFVLNKFFELVDGVYVQSRIQEELAEYHSKAKKNKEIAIERETKRTRTVHVPCETVNESPPNQEPLTINQEPLTNKEHSPDGDVSQKPAKKIASKKTPIPADFKISDSVRKWANEKGHTRLDEHFERFVGSCQAKGYLYADWDAALRNAITADWAKLATAQAKPVDSWAGRDF